MANTDYSLEVRVTSISPEIEHEDGSVEAYRVAVYDLGKIINTGRGWSDYRTALVYAEGVALGMRSAGQRAAVNDKTSDPEIPYPRGSR